MNSFFFVLQQLQIHSYVLHRCLALCLSHGQQFWYRTLAYSTRLRCAAEDFTAQVTGVTGARLVHPQFIVLKVKLLYNLIYCISYH